MEYLIMALQLILSLSILVIIHEFGHFIPAKLFKTRVEKFYLFFDPYFSLFKKKIGETEWGIGWLPLGGYVKISGMVDESMDTEEMAKEPEKWEFRAKPAWQRLIIMIGGVTMNVILAWIIYIFLLVNYGEEYLPVENASYGAVMDSVLIDHGFQYGDKIISLEGKQIEKFNQINKEVILNKARRFEIERNGKEQTIQLPDNIEQELLEKGVKTLFQPAIPFTVDTIIPSGTASKSSLAKGDKIIGINNTSTPYFQSFALAAQNVKDSEVVLQVLRANDSLDIAMKVSSEGKIGVGPIQPEELFDFKKISYSFGSAAGRSVEKTYGTLAAQVSSISLMFTKAGASQMGGFGAIAKLFLPEWNWQVFWEMTALISLLLAFMNILPIPALDGGHVVFLIYEMITGKPPHQKVLEYAQVVGMLLLFTLLIYANGNDIARSDWFNNLLGK